MDNGMKLEIISDGTPGGTQVRDIATGELLHGVQAVAWEVGIDSTATVLLRVKNVPVRVVGELDAERSEITPATERADLLEDAVTMREAAHDHQPPAA